MPHTIRALEPDDEATWADLWKAYLAFYEADLPTEVHASTWSRLLDPAEPSWGALSLRDGLPVGLVHWIYHRTNWSIADTCYLQDLYVAPAARGEGRARGLIEHVAAQASTEGCTKVYWLTHQTNTAAITLYDRVASRSGFIQYRIALTR